jgi:ArsR family transcriptional regulator
MLDVVNSLKSDLFKAISHPTRIQILEYLRDGERCVCEVIEELDLEQSNVSQHLGILKKQDLVTARKAGTKMMYRLKYPEFMEVMDLASRLLDKQLDETREALHFMRRKEES